MSTRKTVGFELREAARKDFSGATTSLPGGKVYDIAEALEEGGGTITLEPYAEALAQPAEAKTNEERQKRIDAQEKENRRAHEQAMVAQALDAHPALKRAEVANKPAKADDDKKEKV